MERITNPQIRQDTCPHCLRRGIWFSSLESNMCDFECPQCKTYGTHTYKGRKLIVISIQERGV